MDNSLTYKKHNFEVAKNKILKIARNVPNSVSLKSFSTSGSFFGFTNHNITGKEANEYLVSPLQTTLIEQNSRIKELLKIADEVYETFDCLDREYIQGIVAALDATKFVSNQAKSASDQACSASKQALAASNEAKVAQANNKKTIEALKETVLRLKSFRDSVSTQIDSISSNLNKNQNKLLTVERKTTEISRNSLKIDELKVQYNSLLSSISKINDNVEFLADSITTIEADARISENRTIREKVDNHTASLMELHKQLDAFIVKIEKTTNTFNEKIEELQLFQTVLDSYTHLYDIDNIWNDVKSINLRISTLDQTLSNSIASNVAAIGTNIAALQQKVESQMADNKTTLEQSIAALQQATEVKTNELAATEQKHKSEIEQTLADHKSFAESLDARMASNIESIGQRISDLGQSLNDSIASNVATIGTNMTALRQKVETQMADDKMALEQSISDLQQTTEAKANELATIEFNHKVDFERVIDYLRKQISDTNSLNKKKFKWAYAIAGTSLLTNIVFIILHICSVI